MLVLRRLDDAALDRLLQKAEADIGRPVPVDGEARVSLRAMADGDGRYLLNLVELLFEQPRRCSVARRSTTSPGKATTT